MIISLIKYFTLCLCDIYIFIKIINCKETIIYKLSFFIVFSLFVSYLMTISETYFPNLRLIIMIILSGIFISLLTKKKIIFSLATMFISYSISYAFFVFSVAILFLLKEIVNTEIPELILMILSCALQFILSMSLFKIKRFKNGFSFMNNVETGSIGLIISFAIIICIFLIGSDTYITNPIASISIVAILLCVTGIIYWWRGSLKKQYIDSLKEKEYEILNNSILEKDKKIEKLTQINEFLSTVLHRDNHIIPSLQISVKNLLHSLLQSDMDSKLVQETQALLEQLERLSSERSDAMVKEQSANKILPTTNVALIDGVFCLLLTKAIKERIKLDLSLNGSIRYMIDHIIPQTSLETLIADHIKDAIIAILSGTITDRRIYVHLGIVGHCYELSVKDTGIPFEIDTLLHLGEKRITTHADTGGSGIGFMTTFATMKETGASLIITENLPTPGSFSKTVCIKFDQEHKYILQSYRYKELRSRCSRPDIIIQKA